MIIIDNLIPRWPGIGQGGLTFSIKPLYLIQNHNNRHSKPVMHVMLKLQQAKANRHLWKHATKRNFRINLCEK